MDLKPVINNIDKLGGLASLLGIYDFVAKRLNQQDQNKEIEELKIWLQKQIEIAEKRQKIAGIKREANNFDSIALSCCIIGLIFAACYTYVPLNKEFKVLNIGLGSMGFLASHEASSKRKEIISLSGEEEK